MSLLRKRLLLTVAAWALAWVPASAQLCANDIWGGRTATIIPLPNYEAEIAATTVLIHLGPHIGCGVDVFAQAKLVGIAPTCESVARSEHHEHRQGWPEPGDVIVWADRVCSGLVAGWTYYGGGIHWLGGYQQDAHYSLSPNYVRFEPEDPCAGGCPEPPPCGPEEEIIIDECGCPSCDGTPILINLSAGPIELSSAAEGIDFDMFGTGRQIRLAWPVSPQTAWLVLDWNANGTIDDGTELFGNTRYLASGIRARHGYEVLAELDANGDGVISPLDPVFYELLLWRDGNRNGISEPRELSGLLAVGIVAVSVNPHESRRVDRWGNRFRYRARVYAPRLPWVRFSYDVFLVSQSPGSAMQCRR